MGSAARRVQVREHRGVRRIVRRLVADGALDRFDGALRVVVPRRLLDGGAADYDFRKHSSLAGHIVGPSGDARGTRIARALDGRVPYAMTGLAGAWLRTRFATFRTTTTFLREAPTRKLLAALGFREEPGGANTWLVTPNDDGVFDGADAVHGVVCAHPVQVFLDRSAHPERAREAADELRARALNESAS